MPTQTAEATIQTDAPYQAAVVEGVQMETYMPQTRMFTMRSLPSRNAQEAQSLMTLLGIAGSVLGATALGAAIGDSLIQYSEWAPQASALAAAVLSTVTLGILKLRTKP
jgi:hypothetical protein